MACRRAGGFQNLVGTSLCSKHNLPLLIGKEGKHICQKFVGTSFHVPILTGSTGPDRNLEFACKAGEKLCMYVVCSSWPPSADLRTYGAHAYVCTTYTPYYGQWMGGLNWANLEGTWHELAVKKTLANQHRRRITAAPLPPSDRARR